MAGWNPEQQDVTFKLTASGRERAEELLERLRKGPGRG